MPQEKKFATQGVMATTGGFRHSVRARKEDEYHEGEDQLPVASDDQESSGSSGEEDVPLKHSPSITQSESDVPNVGEDGKTDTTSESEIEDLKDISFGALAKAQASFTPTSKKRKIQQSSFALAEAPAPADHASRSERESADPTKKRRSNPVPGRSSKHAPAVQSSRHAVSRRRDIFEAPASLKSRDPRFDPTVTAANGDPTAADRANKNYSFLSSYQASEVLDLKAQIKKAKDPDTVATLKRQAMSLESKIRSAETRQREQDIIKRHKQQEREAIKTGQKEKPYFMKRSDVRKEALAERFDSMGKKARDKAMERKRKRVKGKESKGMPRVRREHGFGDV